MSFLYLMVLIYLFSKNFVHFNKVVIFSALMFMSSEISNLKDCCFLEKSFLFVFGILPAMFLDLLTLFYEFGSQINAFFMPKQEVEQKKRVIWRLTFFM